VNVCFRVKIHHQLRKLMTGVRFRVSGWTVFLRASVSLQWC